MSVADFARKYDEQHPKPPLLDVVSYPSSRVRAENAEPRWLIQGKWPADAYGVLGADDKVGKTWAVDDLAVSVVSGTPWLGGLPGEVQGGVTLFLGEGGERNTVRRIDAIAAGRGLDPDLSGLRVCYRVPLLKQQEHMAAVAEELEEHPPVLVILDPLYLAAAGARGSDLYSMGEHLYAIQDICQGAGAALVVTTHWNKTGDGTGAARFTGVGPGAWGRVLASAAVEQRRVDGSRTVILLRWEFTGGEIQDQTVRVRRTVWAESEELDSALHYEVEVIEDFAGISAEGPSKNQQRVLLALKGSSEGKNVPTADVQNRVAEDGRGYPLKTVTVRKLLNELADKGLVDGADDGAGTEKRWWLL